MPESNFNFYDLAKLTRQFASVRRFSTNHMIKDESIAEHSAIVALLAILLFDDVSNQGFDNELDLSRIVYMATLHDIDEIVTGDIPKPTKYYSEESKWIFDKIAESGLERLSHIFGDRFSDLTRMLRFKSEDKMYLKACDYLSVVIKVYNESLLGNKDLLDFLTEKEALEKLLCSHEVSEFIYTKYIKSIIDEILDTHSAKSNFQLR